MTSYQLPVLLQTGDWVDLKDGCLQVPSHVYPLASLQHQEYSQTTETSSELLTTGES